MALAKRRAAADDGLQLIDRYRQALARNPGDVHARRALAPLLVDLGRAEESLDLWRAELAGGPDGSAWADNLIGQAMARPDLASAGAYAGIVSDLRLGTSWPACGDNDSRAATRPPRLLCRGKLQHDIEQFEHLQANGMFGRELDPVIGAYRRQLDAFDGLHDHARLEIDAAMAPEVRHLYGRILHVRPTPRCAQALSSTWSTAAVEATYLDAAFGIVVVDDFLTTEALEAMRAFCLESTLWSANRYRFGRLGAFIRDGFVCPLLLQIAHELRERLPRVIGHRFPLKQLWGFKNGRMQPADAGIHADFAAVNVNFWITPEAANLQAESGGMSIFTVDAPLDWDFDTYNGDTEMIADHLRRHGARRITVPYRANRAIIFNSDLFHGTDAVEFRPGYENRRVNITMLYGERENDTHHGQVVLPRQAIGWRSAAFTRTRRGGT